MPKDPEALRRFRFSQRQRLLRTRESMDADSRRRADAAINAAVRRRLAQRPAGCVGFFWPIRGEPDLRPAVQDLLENGWAAALPVVTQLDAPLEFWRWTPAMEIRPQGPWGIPAPATAAALRPDVLLVPLVGFDASRQRLGYGGGYYDRTLGRDARRPLAVGVGYESGRMASIHAQPHDVPMDLIVTEAGVVGAEPDD